MLPDCHRHSRAVSDPQGGSARHGISEDLVEMVFDLVLETQSWLVGLVGNGGKGYHGRPLLVLLPHGMMPDLLWVYLRRVPLKQPAPTVVPGDSEAFWGPWLVPGHILCLEDIFRACMFHTHVEQWIKGVEKRRGAYWNSLAERGCQGTSRPLAPVACCNAWLNRIRRALNVV